jgi:uncharacterized protein
LAKRVFIVHGWGGTPSSDWYPWLSKMLTERGIETFTPQMPDTNEPHISAWVPYLAKTVGKADNDTYFVGHSMGCQAILRYLESLDGNLRVGGAVFVAGWFHLNSMSAPKEKAIAKEWTDTPMDFQLIRNHLEDSVACFSDNDPYVPLSDSEIFKNVIGSRIIIHPKRGHFTAEDGVLEMHLALNEILKFAKD